MTPTSRALGNTLRSSLVKSSTSALSGLLLISSLKTLSLTPKYIRYFTAATSPRFNTPLLRSSTSLSLARRPAFPHSMSSQKLAFAARHFSKDHAPYTTHQCAYNADKWSRARKELSAYVASRVGGEQAKLLEQAHTAKTPEETAQAITDAKKFDDEEFRNGVAVCVMLCVLAGCAGYVLWITESAMREIEEREKKEVEEMRKERDRKRDKEEKKEFEEEKMAWDRMWRGLSGVGSEECKQV